MISACDILMSLKLWYVNQNNGVNLPMFVTTKEQYIRSIFVGFCICLQVGSDLNSKNVKERGFPRDFTDFQNFKRNLSSFLSQNSLMKG